MTINSQDTAMVKTTLTGLLPATTYQYYFEAYNAIGKLIPFEKSWQAEPSTFKTDNAPANQVPVLGEITVPSGTDVDPNKAGIQVYENSTVSYNFSVTDQDNDPVSVKVYYNGKVQETQVENDKLAGSIRTAVPFTIGRRAKGEPFSGGLQDLRLYTRALSSAEVEALARLARFSALLAKNAGERTEAEKDELYPFWLRAFDEPFKSRSAELAAIQREQDAIKARGTIAHVMHERDQAATATSPKVATIPTTRS
jgi:hypothetical protein